jgi:hypothetical protein
VIGPKDFIAHKASVVGGAVRASGTESDLIAGVLAPMMPLTSSDVFQLQIGSEVDLRLLETIITVTSEPGDRMNDLLDYVDQEGAIDIETLLIASSLRFDSQQERVTHNSVELSSDIYRNALVETPEATFMIVGIRSGDKVLTLLRNPWSE